MFCFLVVPWPLHLQGTLVQQEKRLKLSSTLYVGNLSFFTTEEQIYELFSKCGDIKRIIMGLDKVRKTPCGFCFVEYPFYEKKKNKIVKRGVLLLGIFSQEAVR